jgi:hypothetical protein
MAAGKTNRRMPIGLAALEVQVAAALTLRRELPLGVLERLGKAMQAVLALVALHGLAAAAVELLRLVQITRPQKQVVRVVRVLHHLFQVHP